MIAMPPMTPHSTLHKELYTTSFCKEPVKDPIPSHTSDVSDGRNMNMKKESDRLKTFDTWPLNFIDKGKLAKEGFFYMEVDDRVKCEFCKVEVGRWEEGDDPSIDHQRWAPNCPFLRKKNVGNIPLDESEIILSRPSSSNDICGPHLTIRPNAVCESTAAQLSHGIPITKGPEHPVFATDAARFKSFATWPSSIKQRPTELVDAGFFYTGQGDRAVCFHCGGGLKDWEENDEPWEQHARWFPKCSYVQLIKGREYVKSVTSMMNNMLTPQAAKELEVKPAVNVTLPAKIPVTGDVQPEQIGSKLVGGSPVPDDKLCKICYIEEKNAVFVPCGHVVSCIKCSLSVKECPVCRQPYTGVMRVFFS